MDERIRQQMELLALDARIAVLENWARADHAWVCEIIDPDSRSVRVRQVILVDEQDTARAVIEAGPGGVRIRPVSGDAETATPAEAGGRDQE